MSQQPEETVGLDLFDETASALRTESGTGSTGEPTDRSTMPPNAAFAVRLYDAMRDQSYGDENS